MTAGEALELLEHRTNIVVEPTRATLKNSAGKILAEDVIAPSDVPPHNNSAVDGYAILYDDLEFDKETCLPVTGRITAGHPLIRKYQPGEAIRIFTGGVMPEGLDTVLMQEDCCAMNNNVLIRPGISRGANVRHAGEDITAGNTVLKFGHRLRPQDIGLAASVGRSTLITFTPLRVAVFSTGDELRKPPARLPPGCIYDSNRYTLIAALKLIGCHVTDLGIISDKAIAIREVLDAAANNHDLLVTSGGVSVGEEDHVCSAVKALGKLYFWRLAIRPGRPVAIGQVRRTPFIGLPGNPVAVMVTFLLIAKPMILRLSGATKLSPMLYRVRAGFDYTKKKNRREFLRARIHTGDDGMPIANKFPSDGAGILSSLVESDGLIDLPEDMTRLVAGNMVDFMPYSGNVG